MKKEWQEGLIGQGEAEENEIEMYKIMAEIRDEEVI